MITFLYPDHSYNLHKYNNLEPTFSNSNPFNPWTLEWLCFMCDVEFNTATELSNNNKNYYLFNINLPNFFDDFSSIPSHVWDNIRNNDTVGLIYYQATESIPFYYYPERWDNLVKFLKQQGIPPNKVYYISGDLLAKSRHEYFEHEYLNKINVIGIDIFENVHMFRHLAIDGFNFLTSIEEYATATKKKKFLCLNNIMRPHRQAMLYYLSKNDLIKDGLISALWDNERDNVISEDEFNKNFNFDNSNFNEVKTLFPFRSVIEDEFDNNQHSPPDFYSQTYFSLVNETQVHRNTTFITEKTYKPILMGHPFIIFGSHGTLNHLRKNGYETFPELFDESYDRYFNPKDRLEVILKNLKREIIITPELVKKLKHNQINFSKQRSRLINKNILLQFLS